MNHMTGRKSVLETLVSRAVELSLDSLEIEYKGGYEEVFGLKGGVGFGIARLRSTSREATSLREELHGIGKKGHRLTVGGGQVEVRVRIFDSFGEEAFRVELSRAPRSSPSGAQRGARRHS